MSRAVLLGSLLIATQVLAAKLSVLPFKGPKATTPRAQIYFPLCDEAECIAVDKGSTGGRPDFVKAKRNKIEGLLTGTVVKTGRKMRLDLKLLGVRGQTLYKKSYPLLPNGKLTPKQVSQAKDAILTSLSGGEGGVVEEEGAEEVAERSSKRGKEEAEEESSESSEDESAPVAAKEKEEKPSRATARDEEETSSSRRRAADADEGSAEVSNSTSKKEKSARAPIFALQAGPDFFGPSLQWTSVNTPNLRRYSSPLVFAPHLHGEFYPLALAGDTATGLGVEVDFMISLGSRTRKSNETADVVYPTTATRIDLAARYRLLPIADSRFALTPFFGYRSQSFTVGPSSADGTTPLDGLPNISYSALRLGAGVDVPLAAVATLYLDAAFLPVLSTGEIGTRYFPNAKATGLEFNAGVGFFLGAGFEVRAIGRYTRYGLSFGDTTGAEFQATGAADQQLGVALALRFQY